MSEIIDIVDRLGPKARKMRRKSHTQEEMYMAVRALVAASWELGYDPYDEFSQRNLAATTRKVAQMFGVKDPYP